MRHLKNNIEKPILLEPNVSIKSTNRFDLYYKRLLNSESLTLPKRICTEILRLINRLTGTIIIPNFSIAIQKREMTD